MKRVFVLILAFCLSLGYLTVIALADEAGTISMTASTAVAGPGDTVTVTVSLDSNPGTCLLELIVSYDETRLEKIGDYVETSDSMDGGGVWTFGTNAIWDNDSNSTYTGAIVTLTYKVLEDAPEGEADISLTVRSAMDWDSLEDVSFTVNPATVTVESSCGHIFDEGVEDVDGAMTYTCTVCGYSYTDSQDVEAQSSESMTKEDGIESITDEINESDETQEESSDVIENTDLNSAKDVVTEEETNDEEEDNNTEDTTNTASSANDSKTSSFMNSYVFWIAFAAAIIGIVVIILVLVLGKRYDR